MLISEEDTNPDNVRFENGVAEIGSNILIYDTYYTIKEIVLFSDMDLNTSNKDIQYGYGFDLHIIVEEV